MASLRSLRLQQCGEGIARSRIFSAQKAACAFASSRVTGSPSLVLRGDAAASQPAARRHATIPCRASVAQSSPTSNPKFGSQMLVIVPPHPLVKHWVAVLRSRLTPCPVFRNAMAELGKILIYEATRDWLPTVEGQVETPCGIADVELLDPSQPIAVVPIMRAGTVLAEQAGTLVPHAVTYHLGLVRDEETLLPSFYLNKLPERLPPGTRTLVLDCMLATGGTITAAIDVLVERGADTALMKVVSAIAAPPALKKMSEKYKGLKVYTGIIDSEVNEKGFIVPGLGDAGDRSFGTL